MSLRLPVSPVLTVLLLAACGGEGTWVLETWGEAFIEEGMGMDVFADGCQATYDRFLVSTRDRRLLASADADARVVAELSGVEVHDVVRPGPTEMASVTAEAGTWRTFTLTVAPADADAVAGNADAADLDDMKARGASILASGTLTCPSGSVTFDWALRGTTTYACDPTNLVVPAGGEARTQFTVHGDHLFYDSLFDPDAEVRGEALVAADADADGVVTEAELASAPVAATGYTVGAADVTDLWGYLQEASRTVGHVDGEGHCAVR
ncbi:MAG: hypothetical protein H6732_17425 [Alphaproteobacteria bacterium]|nr:hypothetical protein [Alphaproteobacteria bacterium]